jgi:phospholipid transport system transporter-binding protein
MAAGAGSFELDAATPGTLGVSGTLNFDTAASAWEAIRSRLASHRTTQLDLAGVSYIDSAGLSCVVAVLAESSRAGHPLRLVRVPAGMHALARVSEVDHLIG